MEQIALSNIDLYRFESEFVGTNMYLTFSGDKALIVDPHFDEIAEKMLLQREVNDVTVFLTHEHPDHTMGLPWITKRFNTTIVCQTNCAASIAIEKNNRPYLMTFVSAQKDEKNGTDLLNRLKHSTQPFRAIADTTFETEMPFTWQNNLFYFHHTPGHSEGSCCISIDNEAVFTGDSLILNCPVITRFPGGDPNKFEQITRKYLNRLSDRMIVLAGHGKTFKMKEIR